MAKRCGKCGRKKELKDFHRCSTQADGYHSTCRVCRGIQRLKYREHHGYDIPANREPNPENRPELLDGWCWMPGCCRPSLEGDVVCGYHDAVMLEEGARCSP